MTLLEELQALLAENSTLRPYEVEDELEGVDTVSDEFQNSGRWVEHWTAVFQRGNELVALDYDQPATEMQEGSEGESEVYEVEAVKVITTRYVRKTDY